jgi:hypothetical protein
MRDFEDIDGDCNESQPRYDDESDTWKWKSATSTPKTANPTLKSDRESPHQ